ncbi:uncharacterized protein BO66DRAFT_415240 [Aspergillus aculeatinus CBS 121060]|uniref:Uncharacterized protein n=1 Tax=Aspergillus aculeatinus CBS 121060 TaxID=1448322 RepID=A0ACD1GVY3_9EURO|nr:hypothetical protein BO66DRAFT_415240 [Aspergillus aculeatinus CBS 121060]RAH65362.1 hypothetical protein BO66DRAFT_415240 [Aspergillus aculeatinus CBS 121060]
MNTMVQEPYVNHIATLVSRTISIDRVVDEFIMTFTHGSETDWLIPGISPPGRKLEIPFMAVFNIRGDRLYHEHIVWDQASVLRQLGLLPEYLPYPHPRPAGERPTPGKRLQVRVPAAGTETAAKMRNKNAVPSNLLLNGGVREVWSV